MAPLLYRETDNNGLPSLDVLDLPDALDGSVTHETFKNSLGSTIQGRGGRRSATGKQIDDTSAPLIAPASLAVSPIQLKSLQTSLPDVYRADDSLGSSLGDSLLEFEGASKPVFLPPGACFPSVSVPTAPATHSFTLVIFILWDCSGK